MLIPKTAGCAALGDWAKRQGLWHPYTETPQPGDLVLFDFSGGRSYRQHAAAVISVSGSTLTTIEGNTSVTSDDNGGAVMVRTRYASQVVGYIRPKWTSSQTAEKFLAIARAEVGATEYPANSNKVKYNTWYYGAAVSGSAYAWCVVFLVWCFAVLAGEIDTGKDYGTSEEPKEETTVTVTLNVLKKGSAGAQVKTVQRILYARGIRGADGKAMAVDGQFGANTEAGVRTLQKQLGLSQTGVMDEGVWTAALTKLG